MKTTDTNQEVVSGFLEKVRSALHGFRMLQKGDTVLVAFSGGPDSTALLQSLLLLMPEWDIRLVAAHVHHGIRGAEADADLDWAESFCRERGIPFRWTKGDVLGSSRRLNMSLESVARELRYSFLRKVAEEEGATRIAVGHTRNDLVETLLLHLLRGTGMEGLLGFSAVSDKVIRPLYLVSREETEEFCKASGIEPRRDSSNSDIHLLRNRVRRELLPALKASFNPNLEEVLLRTVELLAAENEVLEDLVRQLWEKLPVEESGESLRFPSEGLRLLPKGLQRRLLRFAIHRVRGDLQDVGFHAIETLLGAVELGQPRSLLLRHSEGRHVRVKVGMEYVEIEKLRPKSEFLPWQQELVFPGTTHLPYGGFTVLGEYLSETAEIDRFLASTPRPWRVLLELRGLSLPLRVRSRRAGDRIEVVLGGRRAHKKLQDILVDAHIPREQRSWWPILVDAQDTILSVPGILHSNKVVELPEGAKEKEIEKKVFLALRFERSNAYT